MLWSCSIVCMLPSRSFACQPAAPSFLRPTTFGRVGCGMIAPTIPWRQHYNEFRDAFPLRDRNLLIVVDAVSSARGRCRAVTAQRIGFPRA